MVSARISGWMAVGCLLWACTSQALAESRALLIGVGEYQNPASNLPGIDLDINIMKKVAGRLGYRDSQITVMMDREVTGDNIVRAFRELAEKAGENDKVLIYYSGHGTQIPDQPGGDEADNYDEALTLYNLGSGPDYGLLRDDDIRRLIDLLPSKHKTLIVDACCSGSAVKSLRLDQSAYPQDTQFFIKSTQCAGGGSDKSFGIEEGAELENVVYLSAAQDDQFSLASSQGSVFTLALQHAFRDGAGISARQLHKQTDTYIGHRVSAERRFNPNLLGDARRFDDASWFEVKQQPAPANERPSELRDWSQLVSQADGPLALKTGQAAYANGEYLKVSIDMPFDGYLNLVVIDPNDRVLLLFPNGLAPDNQLVRGRVGLPYPQFRWPAQPPHGTNHLAAIATREPLNLYQSSHNRNQKGEALGNYLVPTEAGMEHIQKRLSKRGNGRGYHANMVPVRTCASAC